MAASSPRAFRLEDPDPSDLTSDALCRPMALPQEPHSRVRCQCIPVFRRACIDVSTAPEPPSPSHGLGAPTPAIQDAFRRIDSRPFRSSERAPRRSFYRSSVLSPSTPLSRMRLVPPRREWDASSSLPRICLVRLSAPLVACGQSASHQLLQPTRCLSTLRAVRLPERAPCSPLAQRLRRTDALIASRSARLRAIALERFGRSLTAVGSPKPKPRE